MASPVDSTITEVGSRALLGTTGKPIEEVVSPDSSTQTTTEPIQASVSSGKAKEEAQAPRCPNLHALLTSLKIPDGLIEKLSTDQEQPVNFVVVGKYQVGKSALINSMFYKKARGFKEIAIEGDMEPTTDMIKCHGPCEVNGIEFHIYDTMGLQDGKKKDKAHVSKIKEIFTTAHLIIYCTKLQEPIRPDDISTLKSLTKACGKSFWNNAVIALTFANAAAPSDPEKQNWFGGLLERKKEKLRKCFVENLDISEEVWGTLSQHTVPVGNTVRPDLPGIKDWRASFWYECVDACNEKVKGAVAGLAWKEDEFVKMVASLGVASAGTAITAGGAALTVVGVAASASIAGLPVGIPVAVVGLVALVTGTAAAVLSKRKASQSSESEKT